MRDAEREREREDMELSRLMGGFYLSLSLSLSLSRRQHNGADGSGSDGMIPLGSNNIHTERGKCGGAVHSILQPQRPISVTFFIRLT